MAERLTYTVPEMHCGHCEHAVKTAVSRVAGAREVHVDLTTKQVLVTGERLSDEAVRGAIDEAGYEAIR